MARSDFDSNAERRMDVHRDVDIDEDDVLAGLALGINDISAIADIDERTTIESNFEQDVDLDEDDVLAALAFSCGGCGHGSASNAALFGGGAALGGVETSGIETSGIETSGIEASSAGPAGFGGIASIADVDAESSVESSTRANVDIDDEDVLAAMAFSCGC